MSGSSRPSKRRLRLLDRLVDLFPDEDRESLYARILCGEVEVDGTLEKDPKIWVKAEAEIVLGAKRFVSRGGIKLEKALEAWKPPVKGLIWLDAGASTGGFTDCLLRYGAAKVYAVDVGTNQLDWRLRNDSRVIVREKTNIMDLKNLEPPPFAATADLAFRSLRGAARKILGLTEGNLLIALVKPQFEWLTPPADFDGIVPEAQIEAILERLFGDLEQEGVKIRSVIPSPIRGHKGNRETLAWLEISS